MLEAPDIKQLNIAVIGPSQHGKTSLINSWHIACKEFNQKKFVELTEKTITHEPKEITKSITAWDTNAENGIEELDNLLSGKGKMKTEGEFVSNEKRENAHGCYCSFVDCN